MKLARATDDATTLKEELSETKQNLNKVCLLDLQCLVYHNNISNPMTFICKELRAVQELQVNLIMKLKEMRNIFIITVHCIRVCPLYKL